MRSVFELYKRWKYPPPTLFGPCLSTCSESNLMWCETVGWTWNEPQPFWHYPANHFMLHTWETVRLDILGSRLRIKSAISVYSYMIEFCFHVTDTKFRLTRNILQNVIQPAKARSQPWSYSIKPATVMRWLFLIQYGIKKMAYIWM